MHSSAILISIVLCVASTLIIPTTSTYLSMRPCSSNTKIAPWSIYMTGSCFTAWESPRRGTCVGSTYESFICADNQCSSCSNPEIFNMTQCIDNQYMQCSQGEPDFSTFGKNYAVAQAYESGTCEGSPIGALAGPLNKCLANPAPPTGDPNSVYITCENGMVTAAMYTDYNCQSLMMKWSAKSGQCSLDSGIPFPVKAKCVTSN